MADGDIQPVGNTWATLGTVEDWQVVGDPQDPQTLLIIRVNALELLTEQQGADILALQQSQANQDVVLGNHETRIQTLEALPPGSGGGTGGGIADVITPGLYVRQTNSWTAATAANLGFATAASVAALAQVARTGDYNDLINKPIIAGLPSGTYIRDQLQLLAPPAFLSALFIKDFENPTLADKYITSILSGVSISLKTTFANFVLDTIWGTAQPGSNLTKSNSPLGGYDSAVPVPIDISAGSGITDLTGYIKAGTPPPTVGRAMQLATGGTGGTLVDLVPATRAELAVGGANKIIDAAILLSAKVLQAGNTTTGATCMLNLTSGVSHKHTAGTSDVTMSFPGTLPDGQIFEFAFVQDSVGGRNLIFPTTAGGKTWVMQNKAAFDAMTKTSGAVNRFVGRVDGNDIRINYVGQDYRF